MEDITIFQGNIFECKQDPEAIAKKNAYNNI
jgi:hypothetical protein